MKNTVSLKTTLYASLLAALVSGVIAWQCTTKPASKPMSTTPATYTVTLSNSGGGFTITGATNITIAMPDGTVVFKTGTVPIDTTPTNPPVDTTTRRGLVFGVNTNHYQDSTKQKQVGGTRLYLPIGWAFTESGFYGQPLKQGQKSFMGLDDYLVSMKRANVDVLLCLMQSPDWLNGHNSFGLNTNDFPPIRPGLDKDNPASYREIAGIYGAFTKRYGSKVWPSGSYRIDPAPPRWNGDPKQVYKSGLGLVKYIETGNERDVWWKIGTPESDQYMTAKQHAAFTIAVYDSIKASDPNMVVVMAGLTNYDIKYLRDMKAACDALGRRFPADVVNVHHYANAGNLLGIHPPTWWVNQACAPELDKDAATLTTIVAFAKSIGLPVWVTEYGYDTNPGSQMAPLPVAGQTNDRLQADWNVRAALEHIRMGAVRSYVFTLADEPNINGGLFQSCGLLRGESLGYAEKQSFGKFVDLGKQLNGWSYLADQSTTTVRVMKFRHPDGRVRFAYWSPTASNTTAPVTIERMNVTATETVQFLNTVTNAM